MRICFLAAISVSVSCSQSQSTYDARKEIWELQKQVEDLGSIASTTKFLISKSLYGVQMNSIANLVSTFMFTNRVAQLEIAANPQTESEARACLARTQIEQRDRLFEVIRMTQRLPFYDDFATEEEKQALNKFLVTFADPSR